MGPAGPGLARLRARELALLADPPWANACCSHPISGYTLGCARAGTCRCAGITELSSLISRLCGRGGPNHDPVSPQEESDMGADSRRCAGRLVLHSYGATCRRFV